MGGGKTLLRSPKFLNLLQPHTGLAGLVEVKVAGCDRGVTLIALPASCNMLDSYLELQAGLR